MWPISKIASFTAPVLACTKVIVHIKHLNYCPLSTFIKTVKKVCRFGYSMLKYHFYHCKKQNIQIRTRTRGTFKRPPPSPPPQKKRRRIGPQISFRNAVFNGLYNICLLPYIIFSSFAPFVNIFIYTQIGKYSMCHTWKITCSKCFIGQTTDQRAHRLEMSPFLLHPVMTFRAFRPSFLRFGVLAHLPFSLLYPHHSSYVSPPPPFQHILYCSQLYWNKTNLPSPLLSRIDQKFSYLSVIPLVLVACFQATLLPPIPSWGRFDLQYMPHFYFFCILNTQHYILSICYM